MKTLVIIPAWNEEKNILHTIEDLQKSCLGIDYLIVDDGSVDGTARVCEENSFPRIRLPVNLGIGGAVQTGYIYAHEMGYDAAVQLDADGQHEAGYIPALLRALENGADVAVGSRFVEGEGFQSTALRRTGIWLLSRQIRCLCGVRVLDVTSGFRAVNRKMIALYAENYAQDYPEPEALLLAGAVGAKIAEVPVRMRPRQSGKSSIRPLQSLLYMIKVTLAMPVAKIQIRGKIHAE